MKRAIWWSVAATLLMSRTASADIYAADDFGYTPMVVLTSMVVAGDVVLTLGNYTIEDRAPNWRHQGYLVGATSIVLGLYWAGMTALVSDTSLSTGRGGESGGGRELTTGELGLWTLGALGGGVVTIVSARRPLHQHLPVVVAPAFRDARTIGIALIGRF